MASCGASARVANGLCGPRWASCDSSCESAPDGGQTLSGPALSTTTAAPPAACCRAVTDAWKAQRRERGVLVHSHQLLVEKLRPLQHLQHTVLCMNALALLLAVYVVSSRGVPLTDLEMCESSSTQALCKRSSSSWYRRCCSSAESMAVRRRLVQATNQAFSRLVRARIRAQPITFVPI